ncbi:MAG: flagellar hook assembly protein FlgD [Halothiobacillaceae bacterium]
MTSISRAAEGNPFKDLGLEPPKDEEKNLNEMGQEDFLKLLTTQLESQDPFEPTDHTQMVAQMAQFSQLQGLNELKETVEGFENMMQANQVMQAATLVGRAAIVKGDTAKVFTREDEEGNLQSSGMIGAVDVPAGAESVQVSITGPNGELVRSLNIPASGKEREDFEWDGLTENGDVAPAGAYKISASAKVAGESESATTYVGAMISSVSIEKSGPQIQLDGMGSAKMSDIIQILA